MIPDPIETHPTLGYGCTVRAHAFKLIAEKNYGQPVHLDIVGPNGGGRPHAALTAKQARALARQLVAAAKIIEAAERNRRA